MEGEIFVKAGYTLFLVNHRAVPRFTYPAAIEDVQRAVRFIRYHADEFGNNADKIGAVGGSSGGHLVSMLGVLDGNDNLDDDTPINKMSAKVQCVIARAPPSNFTDGRIGTSFLGVKVRKDTSSIEYKRALAASPIYHLSLDDPPFLLIHGDQDETVPFVLPENMYEKLQEKNVAAKLLKVEGGVHGPGIIHSLGIKKEMLQWMDRHLRGK